MIYYLKKMLHLLSRESAEPVNHVARWPGLWNLSTSGLMLPMSVLFTCVEFFLFESLNHLNLISVFLPI